MQLFQSGSDATDEFTSIHPAYVWTEHLVKWYIGDLIQPTAVVAPAAAPAMAAAAGPLVALDPKKRVPFVLVGRSEPTRNTRRLRFALQVLLPAHRPAAALTYLRLDCALA